MPRCFVERCHNYGGKRLNIILHSFPNHLEKIKTWLRCIEGSGHVVRDIEELAERIFQGKTNNRFRVCSEHFTEASYQPSGLRKTLRKDALPTIFRDVPPQKCPWQKVRPALKSARLEPGEPRRGTLTPYQPNPQNMIPINPSVVLDHHRHARGNVKATVKVTEYFQQNTKKTAKDDSSLGPKRMDVTHVILNLTLEIICLLTGEDYIVVKKTSGHGEGWRRTQGPVLLPPLDSLVHARKNEQKILDLTNKIIELLTGEEWEYVEDPQKDVGVESHQALSSLDHMVNGLSDHPSVGILEESLSCEEKEAIPSPTDHTQHWFSNVKVESVSPEGRNITDPNISTSTDETQLYPSTPIKEEPSSRDDGNLPDPEISTPTDQTQPRHASPHIKEEHFSCGSGNLTDLAMSTPRADAPPCASFIKPEPVTYEGGNIADPTVYNVEHYSPASMEEPYSCNEGNPADYTPQHPALAEPVSCAEGMAVDTDTYKGTQPSSTHTECENEDYSLFDKGNLDTDIYALIKHAQAKYTFTRIEDGSSSEEEENSKDTELLTPADHTAQCTSNGAAETVPQTFQCPDCSECFTRKSGLINHRRNHRQEKLTCSKCGKVFSKRSSLQNHLTLHTGEKPYACPICGKCFARKSNLISHETIHSGKASFICAECGRYFVCKVHLTKHQIIHEK
ncbi:uncharacterized protein LOC142663412 [Rhinoderma darwinii]|uniref:uncharacterized protein LOC142663412 n=1 Tax=Rhinoderma darwinii TaxID=43563 RepID=UPI003F678DD9